MYPSYQAVFFDLDGTLLPIDTHEFMSTYFGSLASFFAANGCDPRKGMEGIRIGTDAMFAYDGGATLNSERFWSAFIPFMGEDRDWAGLLGAFYGEVFPTLGRDVEPDPRAAQAVDALRSKGYRLVLATNPLFPPEATAERLAWTGVDPAAFERVTAYHNSRFAKPSRPYYQENLDLLGLQGPQVLMVGNDLVDDGAARECGCGLYLVTDHLIARPGDDAELERTPHGTMGDFLAYAQGLPAVPRTEGQAM